MFTNLYVEMKKANITQLKMSKTLGITNRALYNKLTKGDFTSDEMFTIQKQFFPDKSLEYLFKRTCR